MSTSDPEPDSPRPAQLDIGDRGNRTVYRQSNTGSWSDDRNAKGASPHMDASKVRLNPFRAIPVAIALILNVVAGPLGPFVSQIAPDKVFGYVGSTTFELDGNIDTNAAGHHDWDQVAGGTSGADNTQFIPDLVNTTADDIFTGGASPTPSRPPTPSADTRSPTSGSTSTRSMATTRSVSGSSRTRSPRPTFLSRVV